MLIGFGVAMRWVGSPPEREKPDPAVAALLEHVDR